MIGVTLELDPQSRKYLERLARRVPPLAKKAFYRTAGIVRRKMLARMNPLRRAVAPWSEITRTIRQFSRNVWAETFGGRLMYPRGRQLAIKPRPGGGVVVGWVDNLERAAVAFQQGGLRETQPAFRRYLYRHGIDEAEVPRVAHTPARPVVDPIAAEANLRFPQWYVGVLKKIIDQRIQRDLLRIEDAGALSDEGMRASRRLADMYAAQEIFAEMGV